MNFKGTRLALLFLVIFSIIRCQADKIANPIEEADKKDATAQPDNGYTNSLHSQNPNREKWQKPEEMLDLLGDISHSRVADIGAGAGYFTFRLAHRAHHVIAIDIDTLALNYIYKRAKERGDPYRSNIEPRLAFNNDPLLLYNEVDIVLIVNTLAFIENRKSYINCIQEQLLPGDRILIVDYKKGNHSMGIPEKLRISSTEIVSDLKSTGFRIMIHDHNLLEYQYVILAQKI